MDRNDRSIVGYVMVGHGMVHLYELSVPILMTIWLLEFSVTAAVLGTTVAVGYGLFGVGALPGGLLVDRYGSRVLIAACLGGMGLSFLVLHFASGIVGIAIAVSFWGISASVYHPAGLTLISNGVKERGRGFAYHGMAGNVGIAGGPLVTALLLLFFEWRSVVVILAVPALVAAVVGLAVGFDPTAALDEARADDGDTKPNGSRSESDPRSGPTTFAEFGTETRRLFTAAFVLVFVVVSLNGLYYRGMVTFLPELLSEFLRGTVGEIRPGIVDPDSPFAETFDAGQYLYAGLLTIGIGGQYLGGRLTDRIEPDRGLVIALVCLTVIALGFVPAVRLGTWGLLAASVALGFALFATQPLSQATIAKYSRPDSRGLSFGYTYLAIFGIGALGAAIIGTVRTYGTVSLVFAALASFSALSALVAVGLVLRN